MSEEWVTKRVYGSGVEDTRDRDRPCTRWFDGVKKSKARSLELEDVKLKCMER